MASTDSIFDRTNRRTFSEGACQGREIEEEDTLRPEEARISESSYDIKSIVDIVTCAIHLGIMEDPRRLQCQHAFCKDCLNDIVKNNETIICPVCRANEACIDVQCLPKALVEKQLIEVVMKERISKCKMTSPHEFPLSEEGKEELVKHLLSELKETNSQIFKLDDSKENEDEVFAVSNDHASRISALNPSACSSTFDMMDIETMRENMLRFSCYKDVKRNSIHNFFKKSPFKIKCPMPPNPLTFDIHVIQEIPRMYEIIFVDSPSNKFFVCTESEFRFFYVRVEDVILRPVYMRIINGDLFVTGVISGTDSHYGIFLQCNLFGKVLRKSSECCGLTSPSDSTLPMICGFDVDPNAEKYFLCMPHTNSINVYTTSLTDSRQCYNFDENRPEYVTVCQSHNQIWVSCPLDRRILIADVDTGAFMMFRTDPINDAVPRMIYCTDDDRIIFLDVRSNRFIWIKRRGDYILTQKLHLRSINEHLSVKAFQVLPYSLIVVGTSNEFLVFQPVKLKVREGSRLSSCVLL